MTAYNHEDTFKSAAKAHGTDYFRRVSSTPMRNVRDRDSGSRIVAMMQTAERAEETGCLVAQFSGNIR